MCSQILRFGRLFLSFADEKKRAINHGRAELHSALRSIAFRLWQAKWQRERCDVPFLFSFFINYLFKIPCVCVCDDFAPKNPIEIASNGIWQTASKRSDVWSWRRRPTHQPLDILAFERNVQTIALVLSSNGASACRSAPEPRLHLTALLSKLIIKIKFSSASNLVRQP